MDTTLRETLIPGAHRPRRALDYNGAFGAGWALYSERLADEMGLLSGDLDRLGMLSALAPRRAPGPEIPVAGSIDDAHASPAERSDELVLIQALACQLAGILLSAEHRAAAGPQSRGDSRPLSLDSLWPST
jgi:hypothetical protein